MRRPGAGGGRAALHALLRRRHRGDAGHLRLGCGFARYRHRGLRDRLRLLERLRRHRDHSAAHDLVGVGHVGDGRVGGVGVVDVGDAGRRDHRVAAVDAVEIAAAHLVGRLIDIARRQRKPADEGGGDGDAGGAGGAAQILAAHERDLRRRIDRLLALRARDPDPGTASIGPAAVMGHGIAPGRVVHPGPAPGIHPAPVAVAERRPVGGNAIRRPDIAVLRVAPPGAVAVEVLVADHVARDIARGRRTVVDAVAIARPAIQFVVAPRCQAIVVGQAGAIETIALLRTDHVRRAVAIQRGPAVQHPDRGRVAVRIHVDAIFTRTGHDEGQVGRVHLDRLARPHAAHAQLERSLRELQLHDAIVEIEQRHAGTPAQPDRRAAELQFGPRSGVDPQAVAARQRPVDPRPQPLILARRREAHRPAEVPQSRRAQGRLGRGQVDEREKRKAGQCQQGSAKAGNVHGTSFRIGESVLSNLSADVPSYCAPAYILAGDRGIRSSERGPGSARARLPCPPEAPRTGCVLR